MKITRIVQQAKTPGRYNVFVDNAYAFSLSEQALLESGLAPKQPLDTGALAAWKQRSQEEKVYMRMARYAAVRPRSVWEMTQYARHHDAPLPLTEAILSRLRILGLVDDVVFARAYVAHRTLLRHASKLKLRQELRAKHVADAVIQTVLDAQEIDDHAALVQLVQKKQHLARFRADPQKLAQYLARQGFRYEDITAALKQDVSYD